MSNSKIFWDPATYRLLMRVSDKTLSSSSNNTSSYSWSTESIIAMFALAFMILIPIVRSCICRGIPGSLIDHLGKCWRRAGQERSTSHPPRELRLFLWRLSCQIPSSLCCQSSEFQTVSAVLSSTFNGFKPHPERPSAGRIWKHTV